MPQRPLISALAVRPHSLAWWSTLRFCPPYFTDNSRPDPISPLRSLCLRPFSYLLGFGNASSQPTALRHAGLLPCARTLAHPSAGGVPTAACKVAWGMRRQLGQSRRRDDQGGPWVRPKAAAGVFEHAPECGFWPPDGSGAIAVLQKVAPGPGPETEVLIIHRQLADAEVEPHDRLERRGVAGRH
jgi:hypothetical protein